MQAFLDLPDLASPGIDAEPEEGGGAEREQGEEEEWESPFHQMTLPMIRAPFLISMVSALTWIRPKHASASVRDFRRTDDGCIGSELRRPMQEGTNFQQDWKQGI